MNKASKAQAERSRAMTQALSRLEALEAEDALMYTRLHDALHDGETEMYRVLCLRRSVLPGEIRAARVDVKRLQYEALQARLADAHDAHDEWNKLGPKAEAARQKAYNALTQANAETFRVRGGQGASLQHIHDVTAELRACGAELDTLVRAAMATAPESQAADVVRAEVARLRAEENPVREPAPGRVFSIN